MLERGKIFESPTAPWRHLNFFIILRSKYILNDIMAIKPVFKENHLTQSHFFRKFIIARLIYGYYNLSKNWYWSNSVLRMIGNCQKGLILEFFLVLSRRNTIFRGRPPPYPLELRLWGITFGEKSQLLGEKNWKSLKSGAAGAKIFEHFSIFD